MVVAEALNLYEWLRIYREEKGYEEALNSKGT
jgi:hypothetical protein